MDYITFWIDIMLPIMAIGIPVLVTIYTVNNRIKNSNKENHQPYVILDKVVDIDEVNKYSYYLVPVGRNFSEKYKDIDYESEEFKDVMNVKFVLKNIGYGVATNIKFYNLLNGHQVYGTQKSSTDQNQKLFTTLDMEAGEEKAIQSRVLNLLIQEDGIIKEDHVRLLCIYWDLHGNISNFIISINAKESGHYDFFAYQQSSKSYKKWRRENKKEFKKIVKEFKR